MDELLQDIELLSKDIEDLQVQNQNRSESSLDQGKDAGASNCVGAESCPGSTKKKPFKSELSLFLDYPDNNLQLTGSSHEIETHPTIHPVPSDDIKMLPSPPILKDKQRSATAFELHSTPLLLNGSATMMENLNKSQTFEQQPTTTADQKIFSASETALSAVTRASKSKRVSLSLVGGGGGKKTNSNTRKRTQEQSPQRRRMSLNMLDLEIPLHRITNATEQHQQTQVMLQPQPPQNESRRHSYDSNKSQSHHHKKRSRSDSINSRGTYSEQTSQRRLSITSYQTKSKIPWCGCWGLC